MRNASDKSYREYQNTRLVFRNFFFNRAVYEIMGENNVERGSLQMTVWCSRWIPKAANTQIQVV
jgi:hypothetical protein